jgi:hypothetical protein
MPMTRESRKCLKDASRRDTLENLNDVRRRPFWRGGQEDVNVIRHDLETQDNPISFGARRTQHLGQQFGNLAAENSVAVLRCHHHMVIQVVARVPCYSLECHVHVVTGFRLVIEGRCGLRPYALLRNEGLYPRFEEPGDYAFFSKTSWVDRWASRSSGQRSCAVRTRPPLSAAAKLECQDRLRI